MKVCTKCKSAYPATREYFNKKLESLTSQCKPCLSAAKLIHYHANKESINASRRQRHADNPEPARKAGREAYKANPEAKKASVARYREANPEAVKKTHRNYYARNRDSVIERNTQYVSDNLALVRERQRARFAVRYKQDKMYALAINCRALTRHAFNSIDLKKNTKTMTLLGCSWDELLVHIEKQFAKGMDWDNKGDWHLDHIIPIASAKSEADMIALCHHTNLRPLWAADNLAKADKIEFLI